MTKPQAEWRDRVDFAEVAEALAINTDQVMAIKRVTHLMVIVIYTPTEDCRGAVWWAVLERDSYGVFNVRRNEPTGQTTDDVEQQIRKHMEEFGDRD